MTDDPRTQLANFLAAELEAAQLRWTKTVMKVENQAAAKGAFQSGGRIVQTAECLTRAARRFGRFKMIRRWRISQPGLRFSKIRP
jgi:hypothetical protein